VSLWQDAFAESMSLNMKKLKTFEVGLCFVLLLVWLPCHLCLNWSSFTTIFTSPNNDLDDSFFNEEALYHFLHTHLFRKLHYYDINIPCLYRGGAYLPVSQRFVDRLIQDVAQNLGLSLVIESRYEATSIDARKTHDAWSCLLERT